MTWRTNVYIMNKALTEVVLQENNHRQGRTMRPDVPQSSFYHSGNDYFPGTRRISILFPHGDSIKQKTVHYLSVKSCI